MDLLDAHHARNVIDAHPQELYEPRNYIMGQGGKKMRSLFCLLGYEIYKEDIDNALDIAYCIELFHNFSLVHDDIMDQAELRRGLPAVHTKYGINAAILTGDVMLIEVYERLAGMDSSDKLEAIREFSKVAREVCEGQSMDMSFETVSRVEIATYLEMIRLKTAVLLGLSLRMGAWKAGASTHDQHHLYEFGMNAGIAFQLQDDYLDVYGDPEKFGKRVGGDIIQGKKTYLYLRALELLAEADSRDFEALYRDDTIPDDQKVERVRTVFDELYIPHYCDEAKKAFFDLAQSHLNEVSICTVKKESLLNFALQLMNRSH